MYIYNARLRNHLSDGSPGGVASDAPLRPPWLGVGETAVAKAGPIYTGQVVTFPSGETLQVVTGLPIGEHDAYWDPTGSGNPLLDTGPANKDKKLSKSFTVRELTTSGGVSADIARISPMLVQCLQALRDRVGKGVTITSGFRSWKRNSDIYKKRGKKPTLSQHCAGNGADIQIAGMNGLEIGKAAIDACGPNIGVGLAKTFAHIDVRGYSEAWPYTNVSDSWVTELKRYQKERGGLPKRTKPKRITSRPPSESVRFAQRVMNATQGEQLEDDGDLGPRTRAALARFRSRNNLGSNDVFDGRIVVALAQRALEELAQQSIFPQVGVLDSKTQSEIIRFKSQRGLGFDAVIDEATQRALGTALIKRTAPTTPAPVPGLKTTSSPTSTKLTPPSDTSAYRKFRLTSYYVVDQREVPTGSVRVPIYDNQRRKIAEGSPEFFAKLSLEGTGLLEDKRLLNVTGKYVSVAHDDYAEVLTYHLRNLSNKPFGYSGIQVKNGRVVAALAFHEVPPGKRGVGYGMQRNDIPLIPFRTLAADIGRTKKSEPRWKGKDGLVPPGTRVYIREYDGLRLPDGSTHDGWFVVNDTGGGIFGVHFDVFMGTRSLAKSLKHHPTVGTVWFPGIEQRIPAGYDYGFNKPK
jgi:peptidoglycan hydrolase-like protein with peptidoglycan-binding domain